MDIFECLQCVFSWCKKYFFLFFFLFLPHECLIRTIAIRPQAKWNILVLNAWQSEALDVAGSVIIYMKRKKESKNNYRLSVWMHGLISQSMFVSLFLILGFSKKINFYLLINLNHASFILIDDMVNKILGYLCGIACRFEEL